eukprot:GHVT01053467.1.p1 GENE.GHVT01053467.1~~GHVT01053467.1.p1  ORF type:complete len:118 (+),score=18.48 GHVT01053467.1:117-470(+)
MYVQLPNPVTTTCGQSRSATISCRPTVGQKRRFSSDGDTPSARVTRRRIEDTTALRTGVSPGLPAREAEATPPASDSLKEQKNVTRQPRDCKRKRGGNSNGDEDAPNNQGTYKKLKN